LNEQHLPSEEYAILIPKLKNLQRSTPEEALQLFLYYVLYNSEFDEVTKNRSNSKIF
jgi:hypothetical protein